MRAKGRASATYSSIRIIIVCPNYIPYGVYCRENPLKSLRRHRLLANWSIANDQEPVAVKSEEWKSSSDRINRSSPTSIEYIIIWECLWSIMASKRISNANSSSRQMDISRISNAWVVMGVLVAAISICTANAVTSSTAASLDQVCDWDVLLNIARGPSKFTTTAIEIGGVIDKSRIFSLCSYLLFMVSWIESRSLSCQSSVIHIVFSHQIYTLSCNDD